MAQRQARRNEINGAPVDRFTIGHAAVGVIMGLKGMPFWAAATVAIGWELIENPLKDRFPDMFPVPTHDTFENAAFDAMAMMAGWGAMQAFRPIPPSPIARMLGGG